MTRRRITFGLEGDDASADMIISVYCDDVQIAAAVKIGPLYADATGCQYHVVSHLPPTIKPLLCRDRTNALAWLNFLADLHEGTYKK